MAQLIRRNYAFFLVYLVALLLVGVLQLLYTKEELIRWVNGYHQTWADYFFRNATHLGDGVFFVLIILIVAVRSWRLGLVTFASFSVSSLLSIFFKRVVFPNNLRPVKYFEHSGWDYYVIEGLDIHSYNSFPSGHTISAFAVFSLLAMLDARKNRGWLFALLAMLVGYSRVYLFQHFVEDVYAGSLIGTLSSLIVYSLYRRWQQQREPTLKTDDMEQPTE